MPDRFRASPEAWKAHHPGWEYRLWGDVDGRALVAERYPALVPCWDGLARPVQRADLLRCCVLHAYGGVYADLDVLAARSVEPLLSYRVVLPRTHPFGVSNDFMMSAPDHALFTRIIEGFPDAVRRWNRLPVPPHVQVLVGTASVRVTIELKRSPARCEVHILQPELYSSQDPRRVYVMHVPGDSWAGWDTRVLVFLGGRWREVAVASAAVVGAVVLARLLGR